MNLSVVHYRPQPDHDPYKCIVTSCEAIYMRESKDVIDVIYH